MDTIKERTISCSACHQSLGVGYFTDAQVAALRAEHQKHDHKASRKG